MSVEAVFFRDPLEANDHSVERVLHRYIILRSHSAAQSFLDTLKSHRPPYPLEDRAKVFCCAVPLKTSELHLIFSACSGLQKIGIFGSVELGVALDDLASSGPRPSKLSCDFGWIRRSDGSDRFSLPLFENVTHLELDIPTVGDFDTKRLHRLTHLTHVSLVNTIGGFRSSGIIHQLHLADSIVVCILYSRSYFFLSRDTISEMISDPRTVIAADPDFNREDNAGDILWRPLTQGRHFIRQWGRPRLDKAELDMWDEAEEIVKIQRARLAAAE
ncbi:hypothetical protein C8J56DRAFT_197304 [Mycena floridula]|nr:hypothetical protein C8J56DRAFT_197304 [Mycena floridula]